jgi:light-regulated signal transduction histidine kinase (bacteriophytochrome)
LIEPMKPATAKAIDTSELEDLGRATLQIVHDLKNQLNGIKLYATFLRKRFESEDRPSEEREILAKLIEGLDRAAREMTTLTRYSRPVDLRRRRANLRVIVREAALSLTSEVAEPPLYGEFDPDALSEAFRSLTEHAVSRVASRDRNQIIVRVHDSGSATPPEAMVEFSAKFDNRSHPFGSTQPYESVHAALATRIVEAHGGRVEFGSDAIRAWLPLSD